MQRLEREQDDTELQWALKVERELDLTKWISTLWPEVAADMPMFDKGAFQKFRFYLSESEKAGWRYLQKASDYAAIMSSIVAKCREDAPRAHTVNLGDRLCMVAKRQEDRVLKRTKTEGHYKETREESAPKQEEDEEKKSKGPGLEEAHLLEADKMKQVRDTVAMYLSEWQKGE